MFNKQIAAITAVITFTFVMGLTYIFYTPETEVEIYSINFDNKFVVIKELPSTKIKYENLVHEDKREIDCLARNMYFEAGHEPRDGIIAVGMVTMNRLKSKYFPRTICEIVYQKTGKIYQFSWVPIRNDSTKIDHVVYNRVLEKAIAIYFNHKDMEDISKGALFFHADYINPKWKREKVAHIGRHIFYR